MNLEEEFGLFRVKHNSIPPRKGLCLVSVPLLRDSFFKKAVVLIVEMNHDGAVGFILNKKLDIPLDQVVDGVPKANIAVYFGGPVANDTLHFIHTLGDIIPQSKHVGGGFFWGGDFERVKALLNENPSLCSRIKFFVGYSGWDPGQLGDEIDVDTWLVSSVSPGLVLSDEGRIWEKTLIAMGFKYSLWAQFPDDAVLN